MGDDLDRIARTSAHSFDSWSDFATHADPANYPQDSVFENAVNAVITGDLATLDALLRANPELIHTRSARVHRVTLLHYYGAAVDGLDHDGSPLMTSLAFGYIEPAETLARRGARIDTVVAAPDMRRPFRRAQHASPTSSGLCVLRIRRGPARVRRRPS